MSIKDDVKDVKTETKNLKDKVYQQSLASEILHDLKIENKTIKILLGISIAVNVLIVVLLRG